LPRWFVVALTLVLYAAVCMLMERPAPALAETTVCNGDICTRIDGSGNAYRLSSEEVRSRARERSIDRANDIECETAYDVKACRDARNDLLRTFRRP
jgi:hypothetical protein